MYLQSMFWAKVLKISFFQSLYEGADPGAHPGLLERSFKLIEVGAFFFLNSSSFLFSNFLIKMNFVLRGVFRAP